MKVYTKSGDKGTTSLLTGKRVSKSDHRINAYGTVDELNAWIGLVSDENLPDFVRETLYGIQNVLFIMGSQLASDKPISAFSLPEISSQDVEHLETQIDKMELELEPLKHFVLPRGGKALSYCHLARTVCRRAERIVVALSKEEEVKDDLIKYLNRLSDYCFVLSRYVAKYLDIPEHYWIVQKNKS